MIRAYRKAVAPTRKLLHGLGLGPFRARRRYRRGAELPSILVVTVPKSGTVFTNLTLSRGLSLEPVSVSFGYFPHYLVDIPKLSSFVEGGKVASAHFDPSPVNLQSLTYFVKKWVVHVRDPRSVVLSWVHHMNRLYRERGKGEYEHLFVYPAPPEAYYGWPFCRQVDWNIEHFLPSVVAWTRSWLAAYDSRRYDMLLTTFSELARDELGYIHRILDFYAISRGLFRRPHIAKTLQGSHFRAGLQDEWLTAFSADQAAKATAAIGQDLIERFGWPPGRPASLAS
jgi:Sulfotransferase domain